MCLGVQERPGKVHKDRGGEGAARTHDEQQVEGYKIKSRQSGSWNEIQEQPVVVLRLSLEASRNSEQG